MKINKTDKNHGFWHMFWFAHMFLIWHFVWNFETVQLMNFLWKVYIFGLANRDATSEPMTFILNTFKTNYM